METIAGAFTVQL